MPAPGQELLPLLEAVGRLLPRIRGCIGAPAPGDITPGRDNRPAIARLVSSVATGHPEAGAFFWSVRSWRLLEWQATALAVLGVHAAGLAAPVDRVALSASGTSSFSPTLPPVTPERGPEALLIELSGSRLRRRADALLDDLAAVIPVKRGLALRLLADRVLGLLARIHRTNEEVSPEGTLASAELWLNAMQLGGASRLVPITLGDGRIRPALDRRSCCLHYRIAGEACCASCPRLDPSERLARMRRHLESQPGAR